MAVIFKTFEEARGYIQKDPVGKSWVRLDDGSGFEVKSKNGELIEPKETLANNDNEILSEKELKSGIYKTPVSARVKKKKWSHSTKKKPKKKIVSATFGTKSFNSKGAFKPLEKRETIIKGKVVDKSTVNVKLATHAPKPENKYPKQYIDEPLGTREDSKKMYGRQGAINRSNKN